MTARSGGRNFLRPTSTLLSLSHPDKLPLDCSSTISVRIRRMDTEGKDWCARKIPRENYTCFWKYTLWEKEHHKQPTKSTWPRNQLRNTRISWVFEKYPICFESLLPAQPHARHHLGSSAQSHEPSEKWGYNHRTNCHAVHREGLDGLTKHVIHSHRERIYGYQGGKVGRKELGDWGGHIYTMILCIK